MMKMVGNTAYNINSVNMFNINNFLICFRNSNLIKRNLELGNGIVMEVLGKLEITSFKIMNRVICILIIPKIFLRFIILHR